MRKSSLKTGEKMPAADALHNACAVRFHDWLRLSAPSGTRKRIAGMLGASSETVDSWLDGPRMPGTRHLLAALAAFGPEFAAYVLAPCGEWVRGLSIEARSARIRQEIAELRKEIDAFEKTSLVDNISAALAKSEAALEKTR